MKHKYKRGDRHPEKDLIFWQYHHPYYKETNGEVWISKEKFESKRRLHANQTAKYKERNPLVYVVSNAIHRDRQKYFTKEEDLITVEFIKK